MSDADMKATKASSRIVRSLRRGFTLLELLIVIAILGLLAMLAAPQLMNVLGGAKQDAAKLQIDTLGQSLDLYRLDTGAYQSAPCRLCLRGSGDVLIEGCCDKIAHGLFRDVRPGHEVGAAGQHVRQHIR